MKSKSFLEYETMFIEKNRDKTIGELVDACYSSNECPMRTPPSHREAYYAAIRPSNLNSLLVKLEKDFFKFAVKEEGFLEIPILGAVYNDEYDTGMYAVQELFDQTYKVISFDYIKGYLVSKSFSDCELCPAPYKTIGDLYLAVKGCLLVDLL